MLTYAHNIDGSRDYQFMIMYNTIDNTKKLKTALLSKLYDLSQHVINAQNKKCMENVGMGEMNQGDRLERGKLVSGCWKNIDNR